MILLALDPGNTTGAVAIDWNGSLEPDPSCLVLHDQVAFDDMPQWVDTILTDLPVAQIVIERFFISPRTVTFTRQPEALYVIGGVLFLASLRNLPVRMQAASDAKTAFPNGRITEWPVVGNHAKDALRHALLACLAIPFTE